MSEDFYKYISNKLLKFFIEQPINYGDKYFIEFDEEKQVKLLYKTFKKQTSENNLSYGTFEYNYENGDNFETYYININDKFKLIVADSSSVTMDYLVTLRNASSEQKGKWENTVLLIIGHDINDSIQEGMRDLQKEGMPLHFKTIYNNLSNEIYDENNNISKIDKEIIRFDMDSKVNNLYERNIWDYEDILGLINKGYVDEEDLKEMKLFPDPGLEDISRPTSIQKRLEKNNNIFTNVETLHKYDDTKEKLAQKYDTSCTEKLGNKKQWMNTKYSYIIQHNKVKTDSLEYLESKDKVTEKGLIFWEKPLSYRKAGLRKRHIILFNILEENHINLTFKFDKTLRKKFIKETYNCTAEVSGKEFIVSITPSDYETTFVKAVYSHESLTQLTYEFNIAIVKCDEKLLKPIKSDYLIVPKKTPKKIQSIQVINEDTSTPVIIGDGNDERVEEIEENGKIINITNDDTIKISEDSAAWSLNEELLFNLSYNSSFKIPITIKEERDRAIPTSSLNIWNLKRQNESSFRYTNSKVIQGVNSFYINEDFKKFLKYEKQIIMNNIISGDITLNDTIIPKDLKISENLIKKFNYIIQYYKNMELEEDNCGYPSLTYINSDLESLYTDFLKEYNKEIESIDSNKALFGDKTKQDLNKIGVFYSNDKIYYSSLSPVNMAYQIEVKKQLNNEKIDFNILNRINNENLVPLILNSNDELFKPVVQDEIKEWIIYEKEEEVSIGSTNQFISKVIEQKIREFIDHFDYLFINNSKAPIKLNVINIRQDKEIVKGVFNFIYKRIDKGKDVIPVELNLYNNADKSFFDKLFICEDEIDLFNEFGIKIRSKDIDENDILHIIQNNITYYKNDKNDSYNYEYAHISFYKMGDKSRDANHLMDEIETGLSLNGILSDPTAFNSESGYRIGFGTKGILDKSEILIRTVINTNELIQNNKNKGNNIYVKNQTIVSKPNEPNEKDINNLYEKSLWVTFIEPSFGLEYFDNSKNLIIIHYSDQYTSSNKYDTITVTDKSKQYKNILNQFLKTKEIYTDENKLNNVIKMFNGINGEWLLRVINNNTYTNREKLSVISAIKYTYGLLNHEDIVWIPISMEEILRIAGTVGLSKNEGLFKKSLLKGRFSDDLLFVGINIKKQNIKVYYHPVEVKQGFINSNTITSAEEQLANTIELINTQFIENENNFFKSKFYRNFFMQLALSNLKKLNKLDFWSEEKLDKIEKIKPYLLNDEYEVSNELNKHIGKGSVIAFNIKEIETNVRFDEDIQIVELPEDFAYNGLTKSIEEVCDHIINRSEFKTNDLLCHKNIENNVLPHTEEAPIPISEKTSEKDDDHTAIADYSPNTIKESTKTISTTINVIDENDVEEEPEPTKNAITENKAEENNGEIKDLKDVRALIGTQGNSEIYWEYGNKDLSNRHLLILGKSGFGKTYFMQCLIKEMSKQDIPTLIIDYSDAFMSKEIQDELKEYLGDNLIKYNIKKEKFPLNPFRKNKIEYDEDDYYYEDNLDIASRIKSVFSSVYNLGIVQENTLVRAINNGLEKYAENMSFDYLMEELDDTENKNALSILNQLNEFLLFNPFQQENEFEWSELDERSKKVILIQLHGYSRDIQKIITEFILWDLWNYKSLHGSEDKPFNVILDEAQNLDYKDDSPCIKILKEGRKKGWSVWFATQSIKGLMKNAEVNPFNNANQTIYFHPADNVKNIAGEFTTNNQDKNYWAEKLSSLKKGECISVGPVINMDGDLNSSKPKYLSITPLSNR